jgi:hypothetical protein
MQTGQNSIAPENSLPQLGQVRLGSVLMALTGVNFGSRRITESSSSIEGSEKSYESFGTFVGI